MSTEHSIPGNLAKVILFAGIALSVIGLGFWFNLYILPAGDMDKTPVATKVATLIPAPRPLSAFSLTDHRGDAFNQDSLKGHWTFLAFGYTSCPDICPTTLSTLAQVEDGLNAQSSAVPREYVFVSIDPERDSLERLAEYVPYFNEQFVGVRGEGDALQALTRQLGILYAKVESEDTALGYLMDHSAAVILTDPEGRYHAVISSPHDSEAMLADFTAIVDGYGRP